MTPITQYSWNSMMGNAITTVMELTIFKLKQDVRRSIRIPVITSINSITEDVNQF